ncbi:hypothetical protein K470DRAFT_282944 [Piedraia hortae CBS 480.64]|uniref:DUF572-domain-containing protein n=1 Tax=Piedraia hortae CBS 480.64 TaxID=1314780 RepID=A0A6A7BUD2_9PEZI|nr:hypothetical protein K470DRAFT_282944 [Piedraia hortae CBS 480.64]
MQNVNRYVPPDLEGTISANSLRGRRPPGSLRPDGTQTVRFEMPFDVWCDGCSQPTLVARGTRFNAVKSRVGSYLSLPVWGFRVKHTICGKFIEIRTDPANAGYVAFEGGKARAAAHPEEEKPKGAFADLENQAREKDDKERLNQLLSFQKRRWESPWRVNKALREDFRAEKKRLLEKEREKEAIKDKLGTDMDILPERKEDVDTARRIFEKRKNIVRKREGKDELRRRLVKNTRAAGMPF